MTITKALRKLYKVIVGEEAPANANTITKVLLALAEAWTGGGGSGGGGTEPLIVRVDHLEGTFPNQYPVFDKTWNDVNNALAEGRFVVSITLGAHGNIQNLFCYTNRELLVEADGTYQYTASAINPSATSMGAVTAYADSKDGYLQGKSFKSE